MFQNYGCIFDQKVDQFAIFVDHEQKVVSQRNFLDRRLALVCREKDILTLFFFDQVQRDFALGENRRPQLIANHLLNCAKVVSFADKTDLLLLVGIHGCR